MRDLKSKLVSVAFAASVAVSFASSAHAKVFRFDSDPFAGSTALATPGRQIVGNEQFIANFDITQDVLAFDKAVFGVAKPLTFASDSAVGLSGSNANFIVLRDTDADGNGLNGILNNAALSANLLSASTRGSGAGFFIYFNTVLNLNRLVYSTDLGSSNADLKVLARFTNQAGPNGIAALSSFGAGNIAAVPESATWAMMIAGFGLAGCALRRNRRTSLTARVA